MTAIEKFRYTLSREGYFTFYLAYGNGNLSCEQWKSDAEFVKGNLRKLIRLFLLNQTESVDAAIQLLGADVLDELVSSGIIIRNNESVCTDKFVLICFNSILLFCELTINPQVYFGNDSIALGIYQTPIINGKSVDLCAGTAIQSLIAARSCESSQAVEINPKAARAAAFNIRLNNMTHKVNVINKSLEDFAESDREQYDLITFNPPLLPVPAPLFYPFVGDGGEDGLDVTRRILHLYIPKLTKSGFIEFIGCGLGKDGYPTFVDSLKSIFKQYNFSFNVHLLGMGKLERGELAYEKTIITTAIASRISVDLCHEVYDLHYKKMGAKEMYCFFVKAYHNTNGNIENKIITNTNKYLNWFVY